MRIFRDKYHFEKGYTVNWTPEVFKISEVINLTLRTYRIVDLKGEPIEGRLYENELQKTEF